MFGALDISTSGLVAQRMRLTTISANMANQTTILDENDQYAPYRRRFPVFAVGDPSTSSGLGVHIASIEEDQSALTPKLEPDSPWADEQGYVYYPNVNPIIEHVNAMEALRSYEANIAAIEATKSMMNVALQILA